MKLTDFRPSTRNMIQLLKYVIGGSVYFWSGYLVFAVCYSGLHWDWLWAKVVADVIGLTLNYFVQRYWAFNNRKLKKHEGLTAGKYSLISSITIALDYSIIWGLKHLGISPYISFFISAAFFGVWNYLWYRFWVFYNKGYATTGSHS
jgi:putative flippase GtrA